MTRCKSRPPFSYEFSTQMTSKVVLVRCASQTRLRFRIFFFFSKWTVKVLFIYCMETNFTVYILFMHCSWNPQSLYSEKILKMGPTVLFTHLKIILLQYFSVFSFNFQFSAVSKRTLASVWILQSVSPPLSFFLSFFFFFCRDCWLERCKQYTSQQLFSHETYKWIPRYYLHI